MAVADNQPHQNRVEQDFKAYARRLGDFLRRTNPCPGRPPAAGPAAETESEFNALACELFQLQYASVVPYQRFCDACGAVPDRVRHWRQIPAVPAAAFKEWALTSLPAAARLRVFLSSGTTQQQPSRHFHNPETLALYEASLLPWFRQHLLPEDLADLQNASRQWRFVFLLPPPEACPTSSLVHMAAAIQHHFGTPDSAFVGDPQPDGSWRLSGERLLSELERGIEHAAPVVLFGTAFAYVELIDCLTANRRSLLMPQGSRLMETGGYKGRSRTLSRLQLFEALSAGLGIPSSHMVSEYGMSELSSQAYDHTAGDSTPLANRCFRFPPWARATIVDPETGLEAPAGAIGLIRIHDLANVRSVMAIQTDDLGLRLDAGVQLRGRAACAEPRGCSLQQAPA